MDFLSDLDQLDYFEPLSNAASSRSTTIRRAHSSSPVHRTFSMPELYHDRPRHRILSKWDVANDELDDITLNAFITDSGRHSMVGISVFIIQHMYY